MNWPQAYIMPERPRSLPTDASPWPTTMLLIARGLGPPSSVEMPSA